MFIEVIVKIIKGMLLNKLERGRVFSFECVYLKKFDFYS